MSPAKTSEFKSSAPLARWLICLLGFLLYYIVVSATRTSIPPARLFFQRHPLLLVPLALTTVAALVSTGILFLCWTYRIQKNLPALGVTEPRCSPAWSTVLFLVPVLNLYWPYRAIKDTWQSSDPVTGRVSDSTSDNTAPSVVTAWWSFWLLSNFVPEIVPDADVANFYSHALSGITVILTIIVIRAIVRMQADKASATISNPGDR